MKRKLSPILLLLLPGMLSAATLESSSGKLTNLYGDTYFTDLKGIYDTSSKTLSITNFVCASGEVYGGEEKYALIFQNVANDNVSRAEPTAASNTSFYSSELYNIKDIIGIAEVSEKTIVISCPNPPTEPTLTNIFEIVSPPTEPDKKNTVAPGTTPVTYWKFTFTFEDDLDAVIGDLTLSANLSDITSISANLNYELSWTGGVAPEDLGNYNITVTGTNNFQDVTASDNKTSGTIALEGLQYATPYIFTVTANVEANEKNYPSNDVVLNLEPVVEGGLTLAVTVDDENIADGELAVNYTVTTGTISAGTPVTINIVGDNGFKTYSETIDTNSGTITLEGLDPRTSYQFAAQAVANVGATNFVYSPVALFSLNVEEEENPLTIVSTVVEKTQTSATISGQVGISEDFDPTTPVKVYYLPTPAEE